MKKGKIWGTTQQVLANSSVEFHRILAKAGTKCSEHLHRCKYNFFYVVSGRLLIRVWKNDYDLVDVTELGPGEYTEVPPGEVHQFECLEDCEAFELYYAKFDHDDIERRTVGGVAERN